MPRTGRSKAAREQERAAQKQIDLQEEALELQRQAEQQQLQLLQPFRELGVEALPGLLALSTPEGQADFYRQYYQGPEFSAMADTAQNVQLAASEATGGLQATSTANQLARISPTLGMQALQQQQAQLGNLANIGLSGSGSQAGFLGQSAAQQAALLGNIGAAYGDMGQIRAHRALAPFQTFLTLAGMGIGAATGDPAGGAEAGATAGRVYGGNF